jgi:hypothetical protein
MNKQPAIIKSGMKRDEWEAAREAEIERLRRALKKIEDRTNDPVARSIAGEALAHRAGVTGPKQIAWPEYLELKD